MKSQWPKDTEIIGVMSCQLGSLWGAWGPWVNNLFSDQEIWIRPLQVLRDLVGQEVLKEFERHWSGDLAVVRSCSNLAIGFRGMRDRAEKYSSEVQILSTSPWTLDDPYRNQLKLECLNVISRYDIIDGIGLITLHSTVSTCVSEGYI